MNESIRVEQKDVIEISKTNNVIVFEKYSSYDKPFFDGNIYFALFLSQFYH